MGSSYVIHLRSHAQDVLYICALMLKMFDIFYLALGIMADGCTLSSSDENQSVDARMESFLTNLESSDLQHLHLEGDWLT